MNGYRILVAITLYGALCALDGAWGDVLRLKEETYVSGPMLTLGEVAEIEGEFAAVLSEVELGPAANPGSSRYVSAALIMTRVKDAGVPFEKISFEGPRNTRASTLYLEVSPEFVAQDLRDYILTMVAMNGDYALDDTVVEVTPPSRDTIVSDGTHLEIDWMPNPTYNFVGPTTFRGEIRVDGEPQKIITCQASVETYAEVLVASESILRSRPLTMDSLEYKKVAVSKLPRGAILDPSELEGKVTRSTIFPDQVITMRALSAQKVVRKRQIVQVLISSGPLKIQARAQALADGAAGEVITLKNLVSGKEFYGVVQPNGSVLVQ